MELKTPLIKLYGSWRSGCTWRMRLYFNYRQIPYEYVPVSLDKSEHKTPKFNKMNPSMVSINKLI